MNLNWLKASGGKPNSLFKDFRVSDARLPSLWPLPVVSADIFLTVTRTAVQNNIPPVTFSLQSAFCY